MHEFKPEKSELYMCISTRSLVALVPETVTLNFVYPNKQTPIRSQGALHRPTTSSGMNACSNAQNATPDFHAYGGN